MSERKVWPELNAVNAPRDTERVTLRSDEIDWLLKCMDIAVQQFGNGIAENNWTPIRQKLTANRMK